MATIASEWVTRADPDAAFDRLFAREYRTVVGVAYRVLGDADEAEDVAQEVFCQFYRRYDAEVSWAAPWLHRAAAHTALNAIRGRKRRVQREALEAMERGRFGHRVERSDDPQEALEASEQRREVRTAMSRLPKKSATVLALRYGGLSYGEVATALGVNVGQVGTLLRRAEAALRKEMIRETPQ
jgi:RNA polymerase sigma-70 factor (ECF subfamily)